MLTSLQNPLVKHIRKLHSAKGRKQQQQFLLEGTHLLEEAVAVDYPLDIVCSTAHWQERYPDLWQRACQKTERWETVSPQVLEALATTVQPDGVVAVAPRAYQDVSPASLSGVVVALETIQDPGNLGTIIRTAAAAGAGGLWVSADSADLDGPKVLRASAGAWFRLPIVVSEDLTALVHQCRASGMQVVATTAAATQTYWQIDYTQPTLILLGNEGAGLSPALLNLTDRQVSIPLSAGVESLNVAIAAALILYESQRQQKTWGRS